MDRFGVSVLLVAACRSFIIWRWIRTLRFLEHLLENWMVSLFNKHFSHLLEEGVRILYHGISISSPSFWMSAGRPSCICSRIATALFSHRVRSHSSIALCARVAFWGGTSFCAGVPSARRNGLSGDVAGGRFAMVSTARRLGVCHCPLCHKKETFCARWPFPILPTAASACGPALAPCTCGSTLHYGTIGMLYG